MQDQQLTAGAAIHLANQAPMDQAGNGLGMHAGLQLHRLTAMGQAAHQQVKIAAVAHIQHRHRAAGLFSNRKP